MNLLKTINIENIPESEYKDYDHRVAVRAIIFDNENNVAFLNVPQHNYHKIIGGGVEEGEGLLEALMRECKEEAGCDIEPGEEIGTIVEYRRKIKLYQQNFCWMAKIKGDKGKTNFTESEINNGFLLTWVSIDDAIKSLETDNPQGYTAKFIKQRDLIFLKEAKALLEKK